MGIAQGHCVQTVDGNIVLSDEVTLDHVREFRRVLNADGAGSRGVGFHFKQVALVSGNGGRKVVKLLTSVGGKHGLSGAESDGECFDLGVLVKPIDGRRQLAHFAVGLAGYGARLGGLLAGCGGCLIGLVGGGLRLADAGLCASVYVLDVLGVFRAGDAPTFCGRKG
jgi:hypothetical protein